MSIAISVRQPFASAIALGVKTIDIRSWRTHYRGSILIHASQKYDYVGEKALGPQLMKYLGRNTSFPRGGVIAEATLLMMIVYQTQEQFSGHKLRHRNPVGWWKQDGTFGWVLKDITPLKFVKYKGQQKLFHVDF